MAREIELKVVGFDLKELEARLRKLGARFRGERTFRRVSFSISRKGRVGGPDPAGSDSYSTTWVRVRSDGKSTTLTLKRQGGTGISKREEHEIEVSDFLTAVRILMRMLPSSDYNYIETRRRTYSLGGVEFDINRWPHMPWELEIEGRSEKAVRRAYEALKLTGSRTAPNLAVPDSEYYRMHGIDYSRIRREFSDKLKRLVGE